MSGRQTSSKGIIVVHVNTVYSQVRMVGGSDSRTVKQLQERHTPIQERV